MSELSIVTKSLRAAVNGGDLGRISQGVVELERLVLKTYRDDNDPSAEDKELPNQFAISLLVNDKEYRAEWYDSQHDADGGCWHLKVPSDPLPVGNGWGWRTLDELVDYIYHNNIVHGNG